MRNEKLTVKRIMFNWFLSFFWTISVLWLLNVWLWLIHATWMFVLALFFVFVFAKNCITSCLWYMFHLIAHFYDPNEVSFWNKMLIVLRMFLWKCIGFCFNGKIKSSLNWNWCLHLRYSSSLKIYEFTFYWTILNLVAYY